MGLGWKEWPWGLLTGCASACVPCASRTQLCTLPSCFLVRVIHYRFKPPAQMNPCPSKLLLSEILSQLWEKQLPQQSPPHPTREKELVAVFIYWVLGCLFILPWLTDSFSLENITIWMNVSDRFIKNIRVIIHFGSSKNHNELVMGCEMPTPPLHGSCRRALAVALFLLLLFPSYGL